jgi:hypothetical protein
MSRAITLTREEINHLKFGGASKHRKKLETLKIKHEPMNVNFMPEIPFDNNTSSLLIGFDTSLLSAEQATSLEILKNAASKAGYKIESSSVKVEKGAPAKFLLKHDKAFTFDDIFDKVFREVKELVYVKRKGKA